MVALKSLLILSGVISICVAVGPTTPIAGAHCDEESRKAVDANNMCWYHECVHHGAHGLRFLPRRCSLGSRVSYNFVQGFHNPCTFNFDDVIGYSCKREYPSRDGPPPCHDEAVRKQCFNGGEAVFEADKCWCNCPLSWLGDHDCSKPTRDVHGLPAESNICVNGEPQQDWCNLHHGGCLHGGTCYNQCDTFWCDCPDHEHNDYYGKRCELQGKQ